MRFAHAVALALALAMAVGKLAPRQEVASHVPYPVPLAWCIFNHEASKLECGSTHFLGLAAVELFANSTRAIVFM